MTTTSKTAFVGAVLTLRDKIGGKADRITDSLLVTSFKETRIVAEQEGCHTMLRDGVRNAVGRILKKHRVEHQEATREPLLPEIQEHIEALNNHSLYVPDETGRGEFMDVHLLCSEKAYASKLLAAGKHMILKQDEMISETSKVRALVHTMFEHWGLECDL